MDRYTYRGKRTDGEGWVYGTGFTDFLNMLPEDAGKKFIWALTYEWVEVDPNTIGQCTGLQDKQGAWIFEGDIALAKLYSIEEKWLIAWTTETYSGNPQWHPVCPEQGYAYNEYYGGWEPEKDFLVIGNIHDKEVEK